MPVRSVAHHREPANIQHLKRHYRAFGLKLRFLETASHVYKSVKVTVIISIRQKSLKSPPERKHARSWPLVDGGGRRAYFERVSGVLKSKIEEIIKYENCAHHHPKHPAADRAEMHVRYSAGNGEKFVKSMLSSMPES